MKRELPMPLRADVTPGYWDVPRGGPSNHVTGNRPSVGHAPVRTIDPALEEMKRHNRAMEARSVEVRFIPIAPDRTTPMQTSVLEIQRAIKWGVAAAKEHVSIARFYGESPDPETSMGLWQSFQHDFPAITGVDRDALIMAYSTAFSETVKALSEESDESLRDRICDALPDGAHYTAAELPALNGKSLDEVGAQVGVIRRLL